VTEAISTHKRNLTTPWVTEGPLLAGATAFAKKWALGHLPERPGPVPVGRLSESACLEKTTREGGLAEWIRETLESAPEVDGERPYSLLAEEWGDLVAEARIRLACERLSTEGLPRAKVAVVREPGLKARIVTKSSAWAVTLGHMARERLFIGLRRTTALRAVLRGDHQAAHRLLTGALGPVLSSDLSNATDLFPLDLVRAIVEGLIASGRLRDEEVTGLLACTGPQEVCWPTISPEYVRTSRGILMGLPTTWAILCLVHLYWLDAAEAAGPLPEKPGDRPLTAKFAICGDDAVVAGHPLILDRYEELIRLSGGVLSPGKHFRSDEGRAVFLEELLCFKQERVTVRSICPESHNLLVESMARLTACTVEPTITLRGLSFPQGGLHRGGQLVVSPGLQSDLAAGAVVESLLEGGADPRKVWAVQVTLHARAIRRLRKVGIPTHLPRVLGGAGFIGPKGYDAPIRRLASRKHRRALSVLLNRGTVDPGPGAFLRNWRRAAGSSVFCMAEEDAEGLLSRVVHARGVMPTRLGPGGAPWYDCGTHDEFIEAQTTLAHHRLALMLPKGVLPCPSKGPRALAQRQRKLISVLLQAWPGVRPWVQGTVKDLLQRHKLLVEKTRVFLPGTEDPSRPGCLGAPWVAGDSCRTRMRELSLRALGMAP